MGRMTREEEYQKAAHEYINSDTVKSENMQMAYGDFINGAKWADEHPKNPWRDAQTNPPKEGQEVFAHISNLCGGEYCKLTYLGNYRWSQDEGGWTTEFYNNEVLWMTIPCVND